MFLNKPFSKEKEIFNKIGGVIKNTVAYFPVTDATSNLFASIQNSTLHEELAVSNFPEHKYYNGLKLISESIGLNFSEFYFTDKTLVQVIYSTELSQTNNHLLFPALDILSFNEDQTPLINRNGDVNNELITTITSLVTEFENASSSKKDFSKYIQEQADKGFLSPNFKETTKIFFILKYYDYLIIDNLREDGPRDFVFSQGTEHSFSKLSKLIEVSKNKTFGFEIDAQQLYLAWLSAYQGSRFDYKRLLSLFPKLYSSTFDSVKQNKKALGNLANDEGYIQIYRGYTEQSNGLHSAMSWTLSETVACSFANRFFSVKDAFYVTQAKIKLEDIYDTLIFEEGLTRNELEVLVNPEKIIIENTYSIDSSEDIMNKLHDTTVYSRWSYNNSNDLSPVDLYLFAKEQLSHLEELFLHQTNTRLFNCSDLHGLTHTKRVILNTLTVAMLHNDELGLVSEDYEILLAAAMLHDIGRIHDEEDYVHGQQSVDKINKHFPNFLSNYLNYNEDEIEIIHFLMANHNIPDDYAFNNLSSSNLSDKERVWKLYNILCDGDGVDRVRLRDLNIHYLRNRYSKLMLPLAELFLRNVE